MATVIKIIGTVCVFVAAISGRWAHASEPVNVLFIMADDLRLNLGCYGDWAAVTPNIDRLSRRSVVFDRAYCQFPSCNASRTSMLTGMRPDSISVYRLRTYFRRTAPDVVTLPQHFREHGYHTESIGKVLHNYNLEIRDNDLSWSTPARLDKISHFDDYAREENGRQGRDKGIAAECEDVEDEAYADGKIAADAVATIARLAGQNQPFFLAVGFLKPHSPYNAPKKYWDLYRREDIQPVGPTTRPGGAPDLNWFDFSEIRTFSDVPREGIIPKTTAERMRHGYYAATSYLDANVGRLLDALETNGLAQTTVVVLWSDHGYHLGENDHWTKVTPRDLDTQIPLVVHVPEMPAGRTEAIVESTDIYPTLCSLCELPTPHDLDGESFAKVLEHPELEARRAALSQVSRPWPGTAQITSMAYSLRTKRHRYTQWVDFQTGELLAEELYDNALDPHERKNLAENRGYHDVLSRLRRLMAETRKKQPNGER